MQVNDEEFQAIFKDALRYRWLRHLVRGQKTFSGRSIGTGPALQWFDFPFVTSNGNLMRGSVAEHLDEAIDAALSADSDGGGDE